MTTPKISQSNDALEKFVFIIVILLLWAMASRTPIDSDMWWHLKSGQYTWETGKPALVDLWSFTRYGYQWVNHSWLSQVILYGAYRLLGFWGLGAVVSVAAVAPFIILYPILKGPAIYKAMLVILVAIMCSWVWSPRPQIFSLIFLAGLLRLIDAYSSGQKNAGYFVPVLMLFWSNFHAGYSLGMLLLGIWCVSKIISGLINTRDVKLAFRLGAGPIFISIISSIAVLINPNGLETWLVPFKTLDVQVLRNLIDEWSSPDFHVPGMQISLLVLVLFIGAASHSTKRLSTFELLGSGLLLSMALLAKRNLAPLAIFWLPIITNHLWDGLLVGWRNFVKPNSKLSGQTIPAKIRKVLNFGIVALLGFVSLGKTYFVAHPIVVDYYIEKSFPVRSVEYILGNHLESVNIFNSYSWGGYLIWKNPAGKVFVDGRTDLFGDEIIKDWVRVIEAGEVDWKRTLESWNIDLVLVEPNRPVVQELIEEGWKVLYSDSTSILIQKDILKTGGK